MSKRRDYLAIVIIILLLITSITGIFSMNFNHAYDFINQYGHTVEIFGYGIYSFDSYFQASISIGTDICILFVLVPLFIYTYRNYIRKKERVYELKLISVYAVAFYYAVSVVFGLTYNQLFLVYVTLFSCTLFGMFMHIKNISWCHLVSISKGLKVFLSLSGIALIVAWIPDII